MAVSNGESNPKGTLQSNAGPRRQNRKEKAPKWTSEEAAVNSELNSIHQGTLWSLVRSLGATLNLPIYSRKILDCEQAHTALALVCAINENDLGFNIFH